MTEKELLFLLKYSLPDEMYIVNQEGVLKLLKCPFLVVARYDIGGLKIGEKVNVKEVRITFELITVYVIGDKAFYYYHFEILDI